MADCHFLWSHAFEALGVKSGLFMHSAVWKQAEKQCCDNWSIDPFFSINLGKAIKAGPCEVAMMQFAEAREMAR